MHPAESPRSRLAHSYWFFAARSPGRAGCLRPRFWDCRSFAKQKETSLQIHFLPNMQRALSCRQSRRLPGNGKRFGVSCTWERRIDITWYLQDSAISTCNVMYATSLRGLARYSARQGHFATRRSNATTPFHFLVIQSTPICLSWELVETGRTEFPSTKMGYSTNLVPLTYDFVPLYALLALAARELRVQYVYTLRSPSPRLSSPPPTLRPSLTSLISICQNPTFSAGHCVPKHASISEVIDI